MFIVVNVMVNMYIIAGCRDSNGVMKRLIVGEVEITALTDIRGAIFQVEPALPWSGGGPVGALRRTLSVGVR